MPAELAEKEQIDLSDLEALTLASGKHRDRSNGLCPGGCNGEPFPYADKPDRRCIFCGGMPWGMERPRNADGTLGEVPIQQRLWTRVKNLGGIGCWEWTGTRSRRSGHGSIRVNGIMEKVHRVAWEIVYGPVPAGLCVLHDCDNPPCVRPDHLFLGTVLDNNRDRAAKKRSADMRGERSHRSKLSNDQIIEIRQRRSAGEKIVPLGREFGVHHATISSICLCHTWSNLPETSNA